MKLKSPVAPSAKLRPTQSPILGVDPDKLATEENNIGSEAVPADLRCPNTTSRADVLVAKSTDTPGLIVRVVPEATWRSAGTKYGLFSLVHVVSETILEVTIVFAKA